MTEDAFRAAAEREARRADRLQRDFQALTVQVTAGLSCAAHEMVTEGGLPFCRCGESLAGGDASGAFITHALAVLADLMRTGTQLAAIVEQEFQGLAQAAVARQWADMTGAPRDERGWIAEPRP